MVQLQPSTNAQLTLDLLAYPEFVFVPILASKLFLLKIYHTIFLIKYSLIKSYWDSNSAQIPSCSLKKTMNASCTDNIECQEVKGLSCLNNKCDCNSSK
jgi:hypothetical protein